MSIAPNNRIEDHEIYRDYLNYFLNLSFRLLLSWRYTQICQVTSFLEHFRKVMSVKLYPWINISSYFVFLWKHLQGKNACRSVKYQYI